MAYTSRYAELGVDVKKKGIEIFEDTIENLFPKAFCVISKDPRFSEHGTVLHTDGVGSKPVQSYIHWKETGELGSFKGLAQDVVAMNIDDVICVGASPISFVDYVAVNPHIIPKKPLLKMLNSGFKECFDTLRVHDAGISFAGGETADLPDQIMTLDLSGTALGHVRLGDVISGRKIDVGDRIIGLRSGGKIKFENNLNSGIMCNGITLARHCLMKREYAKKYPEIGDKNYSGRYSFDQYVDDLGMTAGEAIMSPTRLYAPVILKIIDKYRSHISGFVHNTGGGQTKCLRIGQGIHYIKDENLEVDPIFILIKKESGEDWRVMFENYNMGTGFEIIVKNEVAEDVLSIPEDFGLEAQIIGRCEKTKGRNKLTINSPWGRFHYL